MKKFFKNLSFKKVLYAVLTFIMALCIILCSFATVLSITVFNDSFLADTLNSSEYYKDLCVEITESLTDLGDASGLKKEFFEGFVNEVLVREDVQEYIADFYNGDKMKVNTSKFDESLQNALNKYIKTNDIQNVNEDNLSYFSANASEIYANCIRIKYLSAVQDFVLEKRGIVNIAVFVLIIICAAIVCVLLFTNEWKHKSLRYIYTATASAGLFLFILPVGIFASGVIGRIAIMSRSLSDMYISVISAILSDLIVVSIVLIVVSIVLAVIHGRIRKKAAI